MVTGPSRTHSPRRLLSSSCVVLWGAEKHPDGTELLTSVLKKQISLQKVHKPYKGN